MLPALPLDVTQHHNAANSKMRHAVHENIRRHAAGGSFSVRLIPCHRFPPSFSGALAALNADRQFRASGLTLHQPKSSIERKKKVPRQN
jgi:hypothetical protein